jgi:hypothetical protein
MELGLLRLELLRGQDPGGAELAERHHHSPAFTLMQEVDDA